MASTSAVTMAAMPLTHNKVYQSSLFRPLPEMRQSKFAAVSKGRLEVKASASMKEKIVSGLTAGALTASMVMPDVAQAAELSPSLKNFLGSIVAGGVVLTAIIVAIIGVSNFDPVKRG
ncbi:hypothetical protein ACFE04_013709 [Oxalis oulophora]